MTERAFRLDFFIAIAALLISAISAIALLYQTRVMAQQYATTIWPYLSVTNNFNGTEESITVTNDGLGPALVRSAQLTVDGRSLTSWNDYFEVLTSSVPAGFSARAGLYSIGPTSTIRPGETRNLFDVHFKSPGLARSILAHRVELAFCYCSLNQSCWILHSTPGSDSDNSTPVQTCTTRSHIASSTTSPSGPPRRR